MTSHPDIQTLAVSTYLYPEDISRTKTKRNLVPWPKSSSELRPSDRRLLAKLVPTFADRGCHVVSVTDLYDSILGFLDRVLSYLMY
jgi:hypothetical protein